MPTTMWAPNWASISTFQYFFQLCGGCTPLSAAAIEQLRCRGIERYLKVSDPISRNRIMSARIMVVGLDSIEIGIDEG
ncbi:hypothetical protein [Mesorhizobium caraganae]|uniref:hypothetical protein n=1 Tax=Mesorhizobium caraganae TaxID=483206 RepID=UPI003ECCC636